MAACRQKSAIYDYVSLNAADRQYVQILEHLESAGNRYCAALDLQKLASAPCHLEFAGSFPPKVGLTWCSFS